MLFCWYISITFEQPFPSVRKRSLYFDLAFIFGSNFYYFNTNYSQDRNNTLTFYL